MEAMESAFNRRWLCHTANDSCNTQLLQEVLYGREMSDTPKNKES